MCPASDSDSGARRASRISRRTPRSASTWRPDSLGFDTQITARVGGRPVECFRFIQGSNTFRYTSADTSITLAQKDQGTYQPSVITRGEIDFSQEDVAQNIEITVPAGNDIALLFRIGSPTGSVLLAIFTKDRNGTEEALVFAGKVVACQYDGAVAKLVCAPLANVFTRTIPSIMYQPQCNWPLFSAGCGVAKAGFKVTGTITAISGATLAATAWASSPDGWFTNGWAEIAATGERRFIVDHVGSVITLMNGFDSLAVGASVDAYAGCDRTEAICAAKFNNLVNHLGFPRIPTRNPYGGGSIV